MYDSSVLLHRGVANIRYLPISHIAAFETYVRGIAPPHSSAQFNFHNAFLAIQSTIHALLSALGRPTTIIAQIQSAKREVDRNSGPANRSSRWPLGLLDDARQRLQDEKDERARKSRAEAEYLSRELRYTQQTVASELAGWQSMHEMMGRRAIKEYAKQMMVQEKIKLSALRTALRKIKEGDPGESKLGLGMKDTVEVASGTDAVEE